MKSANKDRGYTLDALNVFVADMRDGVGPYLAIFLAANAHWTPSQVGWALAAASISTLFFTGPAGWILDSTRHRRLLISVSSLAIALLTFLLSRTSDFTSVVAIQFATGIASALIGPGIAALSLEFAGRDRLPKRIGRNEMFNHAGNFAAAVLAAYLIRRFSISSVFVLVVVMSVLSACSVWLVPKYRKAKEEQSNEPEHGKAPIGEHKTSTPSSHKKPPRLKKRAQVLVVLTDVRFLSLLLIAFVYQLTNASLLPIEAQQLSSNSVAAGTKFLSYGVVIAQLVAIPAAWATGALSKKISATFCIGIGLVAVSMRAFIFSVLGSAFGSVYGSVAQVDVLIASQVFDGIAAGVIAVAPILSVFEVTKNTGRFTMAAGILATAIGLGACLSNIGSGYLTEALGPSNYFGLTAAVALSALILLGLRSTTDFYVAGFRKFPAKKPSLPEKLISKKRSDSRPAMAIFANKN